MPHLLLLPGLDGTGRLFSRITPHVPDGWIPKPVAYPPDRTFGLDGYAAFVRSHVPSDEQYAIVAESFSGPIALRLAARQEPNLRALVLVATFVTPPMNALSRWVVRAGAGIGAMFTPPKRVIQAAMLGRYEDPELAAEVQSAVGSVNPNVLASRFRLLAKLDAQPDLQACSVPILYLAGSDDRLVSSEEAEPITRHPSVTAKTLRAPHLVLQTQPEAAAVEIGAFLSDASQPAQP